MGRAGAPLPAVSAPVVEVTGLTKVFGRFHAKALLSSAFRAPGIMNIQAKHMT